MIEAAVEKGYPVNFDLLGLSFSQHIKPGPRGPQMRSNRLSFFKEITSDEMRSYAPDQIATILEQRDNLHHVLAQQQNMAEQVKRPYYMPSSGPSASANRPPPGFGHTENKPWVPDEEEECQFKCCHTCRPTCESRSYLSLDGIGRGDILPSAAVGFGFHLQGSRPVLNADIVKNIGYRPVPLPRSFATESITTLSSRSSIWSILDIIDEQIVELARLDADADSTDSCLGSAKAHKSITGGRFDDAAHLKSSAIRPPWTPPTTPSAWNGVHRDQDGIVHFDDHPMICNGRSPDSLKTNPDLRRAAFESILSQSTSPVANYLPQSLPNMHHYFPYALVDENDVGLFLPFNKTVYMRACLTPLPMPSSEEDAFLHDKSTLMMEEEMEEGRFHDYPLDVADGVAMMEESVGLGVPDVMMQA